jgi:hypothetical protein
MVKPEQFVFATPGPSCVKSRVKFGTEVNVRNERTGKVVATFRSTRNPDEPVLGEPPRLVKVVPDPTTKAPTGGPTGVYQSIVVAVMATPPDPESIRSRPAGVA